MPMLLLFSISKVLCKDPAWHWDKSRWKSQQRERGGREVSSVRTQHLVSRIFDGGVRIHPTGNKRAHSKFNKFWLYRKKPLFCYVVWVIVVDGFRLEFAW